MGAAVEQLRLTVEGMSCDNCVRHVERALRGLAGVESADVDLAARSATVRFDADVAGLDDFRKAVDEAGYSIPA